MHVSTNAIGLLFGFSLFSLLVYKLAELVKAYLIPLLYKQMHEMKKERAELLDREKLVTSTLSKIDNQRNQQKKMFILLEKKIQMWHNEVQLEAEKREDDFRVIAHNVEEKRGIQEHNFAVAKTTLNVLPAILQKVRRDLLIEYKNENLSISQCIDRFAKNAKAKV